MYYANITIDHLEKRVIPKIENKGGHLLWAGAKSSAGYPYWAEGMGKRNWRVHRLMYALTRGVGMLDSDKENVIDHICNVKLCVRPRHLQMISQRENVRRNPVHDGTHYDYHKPEKHSIKPSDLYLYKTTKYGKYYRCRPCFNEYVRNRRLAKLDKQAGGLSR